MRIKIRTIALGWALLSLASFVGAQAPESDPVRAPVRTENFSGEKWVGQYAADAAPNAVYAEFQAHPELALYVDVFSFVGKDRHWCVAHAGLTHAAPNVNTHPRAPAFSVLRGASGATTESIDGSEGCTGRALKYAIQALFENPQDAHDNFARTAYAGANRARQPTNRTMVQSTYFGMNEEGSNWIVKQFPEWFGTAFDYRQVQLFNIFGKLDGDSNERICFAYIGMTARAPDDREPRVAPVRLVRSRLLSASQRQLSDDDSECFDPLFQALADQIVPDADPIRDFIAHWATVAESGLVAPNAKNVATAIQNWQRVSAAPQKKRAESMNPARSSNEDSSFPSRPAKQAGVTSCNTQCDNGDCRRTYDNGRHVHFQANQSWNPLNNQLEWNAGTC